MWEESWVNLVTKMQDMPYYHHFSSDEKENKDEREGTIDDLKSKFGKYIQ